MARDYVQELKQLLPRGKAWPRAVSKTLHKLIVGIAPEFERVEGRSEDLLAEMDPRSMTELLPDWETFAGLPELCAPPPTTLADRRAALTAKIISRGGWSGGPSVPFLTALIVALGYDVDHILIRRFHLQPFTCMSACDDVLWTEAVGWIFVWEIIVRHGALDEQVVCTVSHYALAHLELTFAFPLFFFGDGVFSRAGAGVFTDPETGDQTTLTSNALGTVYIGA